MNAVSASVRSVPPLTSPPRAVVRPPGSKSLTNRALICAALAEGSSRLDGVLLADDTRAMLGAVAALGAQVALDEDARVAVITGTDPRRLQGGVVDARQSGTTLRFVLPVLALASGSCRVDGAAQLRARPLAPQAEALRRLGATVIEEGDAGRLPLKVSGPLRGGTVELPGHLTSQFLSGLLMAGPLMQQGLRVGLTSAPVSLPYLEMTRSVMTAFGCPPDQDGWGVRAGVYRGAAYSIEPDASAASYFWAAGALTGGSVTVDGLGTASTQGDVAFVDVLQRMGATVERSGTTTTVRDSGVLHGIDVDMADISDTAQTLAAVAVFADSPTRVRGIGFIRAKETDRIAAVVTELRRAGIDATEDEDGFTIRPGNPRPTTFATYDDHRMAMSLSVLGLRAPGVEIADPGCVAKTYPSFFDDLDRLRR
jgi:3-phosphoshikimate 1-carboxyvinyltransferase